MKSIKIILILMLCIGITTTCFADIGSSIKLLIDGTEIEFNSSTGEPYISSDNRIMIPLRACIKGISGRIDWNQDTQTALIKVANTQMQVPIGSDTIKINYKDVKNDSPATLINGRTYLPIRAVLEGAGYAVEWDNNNQSVIATLLTPENINGGKTGIFSRKQLDFSGFTGIEADITLPYVNIAEKGDCPYVYFGFDFKDDIGNAEGGFQFIEAENHKGYNKWTICMRQGKSWISGKNEYMEQGSTHHLRFFVDNIDTNTYLVIELDGVEVARKLSDRNDFESNSIKCVVSMAMPKVFTGSNCHCSSTNTKIENLMVSKTGESEYTDFYSHNLYKLWKPSIGESGMWYGTSECLPSLIEHDQNGNISINK